MICVTCFFEDEVISNNINGRCDRCNGTNFAEKEELMKDVYEAGLQESLSWAAQEVYKVNKANGWFTEDRTVGEDIALLHSEVSEMLEAYRAWGLEDATCQDPQQAEVGFLAKPEGFASELADVFIRMLDVAYRYDINLQGEFSRKLAYNATRGFKHGNKKL